MASVDPTHYSEGDCLAAVSAAMKDRMPAGFELRFQVKLRPGPGSYKRGARLDLAVIESTTGRIILVVEVKRSPQSSASAQGERYGRLAQCPVLYLRGIKACRECPDVVLEALAGIA